ncbi:MAG: hypothetical protein M1829_003883 [Trizodia sp. TS-e1964]|nr:MAG: hypothetical protein M1829_003883 [Trizodia sp. TS-e1964]
MVTMGGNRASTPSTSPPPTGVLPSIPEGVNGKPGQSRRSSLGFLRRSKSGEPLSSRSTSGSRKIRKEQAILQEQELLRRQREAAALSNYPPRLPDLYNGETPPNLRTFDSENPPPGSTDPGSNMLRGARGSMDKYGSKVPVPPIPLGKGLDLNVDPYARTESMTNRGRYSYASSAISSINSPRRVRRRKDPTPFNILVIGARNSGKTSFINFLRSSLALPHIKSRFLVAEDSNPSFTSNYIETEIEGERIGLTLWDSQGLEENLVDLQLREMSSFLESKFEDTFNEEMKVVRAPGVRDTHIHCAFLILDPVRLDSNIATAAYQASSAKGVNGKSGSSRLQIVGGLDENLDLQVLRTLQGKTTVVPVISKADTITSAHMTLLKKTVWDSLKLANLDPLEALGMDELEGGSDSKRSSQAEELEAKADQDSGSIIKQSLEPDEPKSATGAQDPHEPNSSSPRRSFSLRKRLSDPTYKGVLSEHDSNNGGEVSPYLPLSIISPDIYDPGTVGRKFPWGFADPYNPEHCDFMRLKEAVFTEWRGELREASRELWYEGWRTSRLRVRKR